MWHQQKQMDNLALRQFGTRTHWHRKIWHLDNLTLNIWYDFIEHFFLSTFWGYVLVCLWALSATEMKKKYFLSSDFCQQFELKVIIWCLGARNFANSKSISILRYAQQNIFWKHQKNSSYLATATNAGQNMLSLCSGLSHPYNKRRYSGEYIFSVAICKPHDPNVLFQPLVLCYI